jgi:glycine/D-amino acid oxidase-like deaminating enzyme
MKFTSYWLDTSPAGPDRSRTELGGHADVAVVGAGLTGLSAALHLARKGATVAVLESETVGWGASGRNGGMTTSGMSLGFRVAIQRYGFETAKVFYQAYNDAIDTVAQLIADEGLDCDFAWSGKLLLASKPAHFDGLRKTHELLDERLGASGSTRCWWPPADTPAGRSAGCRCGWPRSAASSSSPSRWANRSVTS